MPVSAIVYDGTWSNPFFSMNAINVNQLHGNGDYLWFISDEYAGRLNVISNEFVFYDNSHFNEVIDWEDYMITASDSTHVVLYNSEIPSPVWVYNGISWRKIETETTCDYLRDFSFDNKGNLWCIGNYLNNDHELYIFNDTTLESPVELNNFSKGVLKYAVDDSGVVWFSEATPSTLYSFDLKTKTIKDYSPINFTNIIKDTQGKIYLVGDSAVYSVTENLKMIPFYEKPISAESYLIDSDNNLWCFSRFSKIKIDLHNTQSVWNSDTIHESISQCANKHGVYQSINGGLLFHRNNDTSYEFISFDSIRCVNCGEPFSGRLLFRKNGSLVYLMESVSGPDLVIERENERCHFIPLPETNALVSALFERKDGTLIAGINSPVRGLYHFNGTTWELYPGTENTYMYNFCEDKNGKIWSVLDNRIIHQTASGWELIDHKNSNLPEISKNSNYYENYLKEDSDGAIWAKFDSSIVKTFDGYNWTIYNEKNTRLSEIKFSNMFVNHNGNIQILCYDTSNGSTKIIRATFVQNDWHYESIPFLKHETKGMFLDQDSRGTIYVLPYSELVLYSYNTSNPVWTRLDSTVIPYTLFNFMGDDGKGMFYFKTTKNETVVCGYSETPVQMRQQTVPLPFLFTAHTLPNGNFSVEYALAKPGILTLNVFSLDGRLVKTLFTGYHKQGRFHRTFEAGLSRGIYLLKLKYSGNSLVTRMLAK